MSALGSLVVKLALEYAEYTQGLDKSDQAALAFAQRTQRHFDQASKAGSEFFDGIAKRAIGAAAAYMSLSAALDTVSHSIDNLATLDDLNQKTGSSVENLSRLQQVASAFGHDFGGAIDGALTKLARGMAGADDQSSKVGKALKALGVTARDTAGHLRDPSEVLVDAAKSLSGYEDGAAKAALATDLLGKTGAELLPFLNDVAESVDKFNGVSQQAAADAAKFQDQLGVLRTKFNALVTSIVSDALPAMNDLVGAFSDTLNKSQELNGGKPGQWADDLAVGLSRVVDVAILLPRLLRAVGGSFESVWADAKFAATATVLATPVAMAKNALDGKNPLDEIRKAAAERNKVVEEANQRYLDLWNKPANELEQAILERIKKRTEDGGAPNAPAPAPKPLNYGGEAAKSDFEALNKSLQERLALTEREVVLQRPLTDGEKELASLARGRAEGTIHLTDVEARRLETGLRQLDTERKSIDAYNEVKKLFKELEESNRRLVEGAEHEAEQNETLAATFGKTKAQIEALELARLEDQLAQRASTGLTMDEIAQLEKLIAAKKRSAAALQRVDDLQGAQKSLDDLNAFLDPAKAQSFGEALKEAFGSAGESISKVTAVLDSMGQKQAEIAKQKGNAANALLNGLIDEKKYNEDIAKLNEEETKNRLAGYGDMAGAAAGFFGEQSRGYQALMTVSKVFHAAELAMTLARLIPKGIEAVLNQGTGDPYSAFARMAAMAAIVTGLGVAIGGIGGGADTTAKDRQESAGTGTVLGDAQAKSDSISKSLEVIEKNSDIELSHTAGMLHSLRNIESSIAGLGNVLVRSGVSASVAKTQVGGAEAFVNSTLGTAILGGPLGLVINQITGGLASKLVGKVAGAIFGGKVTGIDAGITAQAASLGGILDGGLKGSQYSETKTSGGWFHSDKYNTTLTALSGEANDQFTKVITGLASTVTEAANLLGVGGDDFTAHLNSFVVDIGKISLKDLKPDEIQEQLEAVFSKLGDQLAQHGVAGLAQFQKVGEGYLETLTRVAADYANLDSVMASIGRGFGAVGLESIAARERLIDLAGGIDKLAEQTSGFAENYLTEAERLAPVQKYVTEQLAAMGYSGIKTRDQFKALVLGIDTTTEAGARQYAALLALQGAFAQVYPAMTDVKDAAADAAGKLRDAANALLANVDDAFNVLQGVVARERAARAAAHEAEMSALQKRIDLQTASIGKLQTLSQALHASLDQLVTAQAGLGDRRGAQAEIKAALAIARAGGPLPEADSLRNALSVIGRDASNAFGSYSDYLRDYYTTANDISELGDLTDSALSVEEKTLDALNAQKEQAQLQFESEMKKLDEQLAAAQQQVDLLKGNNAALLSLTQALAAFGSALQAAQANPIAGSTGPITQAYQTYLGRNPEAEGLAWWQQQAANGLPISSIVNGIKNSNEAKIQNLYGSILGRGADADGLQFYMNAISGGASIDQVRGWLLNSDEYQNKVPAFALGGDHEGGLRLVGERGPELEVTGPSRIYNAQQTASLLRGGGSQEVVRELKELRKENSDLRKMMESHLYAIAKSTRQTADLQDTWEVVGQPKVRAE